MYLPMYVIHGGYNLRITIFETRICKFDKIYGVTSNFLPTDATEYKVMLMYRMH